MNLKDMINDLFADLERSSTAFTTVANRLLSEDLSNPELRKNAEDPDYYGLRANEVGKQLILSRHAELASHVYKLLIAITEKWVESNEPRHLGMFYANLGAALALMGDLDRACIAFWKAAAEDKITYDVAPEDTFALTTMFQDYIVDPALQFVLKNISQIDPHIGMEELRMLYKSLGINRYSFAAYLHIAKIHCFDPQATENQFSQFQKLNVIRSLTALLEEQLRIVTGAKGLTIWEMLEDLHGNDLIDWFDEFCDKAGKVGATRERKAGINYQLKGAFKFEAKNDEELFCNSMLIAYIIRNFSAHNADIHNLLITTFFERALGQTVYAMYCCSELKLEQ